MSGHLLAKFLPKQITEQERRRGSIVWNFTYTFAGPYAINATENVAGFTSIDTVYLRRISIHSITTNTATGAYTGVTAQRLRFYNKPFLSSNPQLNFAAFPIVGQENQPEELVLSIVEPSDRNSFCEFPERAVPIPVGVPYIIAITLMQAIPAPETSITYIRLTVDY